MRWCHRFGAMWWMAMAFAAPFAAQQPVRWRDPSPHSTQFVTVDRDVRLEVLDWGGSGRPILLLAGGGNTAHVFDEFAPKLTGIGHVYGLTRRGFGASTYSASEKGGDRLGNDVLAVIRALRLNRPVLVGHSIAGAELSSVAALQPGRIAGVVYLEAAYPYAFESAKGPTMKDFLELRGPQPAGPGESDRASFRALQTWDARTYGFRMPESELRAIWGSTSRGRVTQLRDFPGSSNFAAILTGPRKYGSIRVPVLAIFAIPHVRETWMSASADPAIRRAADAYFARLDGVAGRQAKAFEEGVPGARVVRLRGMHYIFLSNQTDVLRELRSFLGRLK